MDLSKENKKIMMGNGDFEEIPIIAHDFFIEEKWNKNKIVEIERNENKA